MSSSRMTEEDVGDEYHQTKSNFIGTNPCWRKWMKKMRDNRTDI